MQESCAQIKYVRIENSAKSADYEKHSSVVKLTQIKEYTSVASLK
jgi:hypothetical protein